MWSFPSVDGKRSFECIFNLPYVVVLFEAPAVCKPGDVSINGECWFIETLAHYDRSNFVSDTGNASSSENVEGTRPLCFSQTILAVPIMYFDLSLENPHDRMIDFNRVSPESRISRGVFATSNSWSVTTFTTASVHCADRITETTHVNISEKFSWISGAGNNSSNLAKINFDFSEWFITFGIKYMDVNGQFAKIFFRKDRW
jgi:hypothetical protein